MKCELCQKADAVEAIIREGGSPDDELYVCAACAKAEREKHQHKRSRTRKVTGLPPGVSMSITEISRSGDVSEGEMDEPPPFLGAIMDAFQHMVNDLEQVKDKKSAKQAVPKKMQEIPASRIPAAFRMRGAFHLEGLNLIGELNATKRALHALNMDLVGSTVDGVQETGHIYRLRYSGTMEQAKRVAEDLLRQEKNARIRLRDELPRIFGDAICRALAILKNCRLLSSGELFDLLSPMRLAAREKMLDGITLAEIDRMMADADLSGSSDRLPQDERDRIDAERADEMNKRFEEVMLNDVL